MVFGRAPHARKAVLVLGVVVEVLGRRAWHVADFEARQAMTDVGGVADLRHLAVRDDVDAGFLLLEHDIGDGVAHDGVVSSAVEAFALGLREQLVDHGLRSRQAADVGGEDAVAG